MEINYICEWNNNKKLTWSGTTYSLYEALKNKFDVLDNGFVLSPKQKRFLKFKALYLYKGKIHSKLYNKGLLKYYQSHVDNILTKKDNIILEIGDLGISKKNDYYIYQDLSFDFLIDFSYKNKQLFDYSGFQTYSKKDLKKRAQYQKEIYSKAKGIFTMSKFLKEHLVNYTNIPENKVHYIGAGTNLDTKLVKPDNKNRNKILFVGRDFYRKGGELVCQAFRIVKKDLMDNAELYIIGPSSKDMEDIKNKYGYPGINFVGEVNDKEELSKYFNLCDIFCMPSRFEAYGIAFIEALIYGLPCIGRKNFAMNEIIQNHENGLLIDDDNAKKLAYKIVELLKNDKIFNRVNQDRDKYIKEYSWDTVAEKIKNVFEKDAEKRKNEN